VRDPEIDDDEAAGSSEDGRLALEKRFPLHGNRL
jgi:hypothetical protein